MPISKELTNNSSELLEQPIFSALCLTCTREGKPIEECILTTVVDAETAQNMAEAHLAIPGNEHHEIDIMFSSPADSRLTQPAAKFPTYEDAQALAKRILKQVFGNAPKA